MNADAATITGFVALIWWVITPASDVPTTIPIKCRRTEHRDGLDRVLAKTDVVLQEVSGRRRPRSVRMLDRIHQNVLSNVTALNEGFGSPRFDLWLTATKTSTPARAEFEDGHRGVRRC